MSVRSSQSITALFTTHVFATGAASNADSLPTGTLYVNGTADAASVTVTNITTGVYKAQVTLPTLSFGDVVDLRINATVSSVSGNAVIWRDTKDIAHDASGLVAVPDTQKVDLDTIKTQAITCGAGVTVGVYVGGTGAAALASDATAIKAVTDALGATAAARLQLSALQIIPGTVDTVVNSHTPTTTEFQADDITEATADHYNGRIIIFTSGALAGQATSISDYVAVGGIGQFSVVALTEAPTNNDSFVIL